MVSCRYYCTVFLRWPTQRGHRSTPRPDEHALRGRAAGLLTPCSAASWRGGCAVCCAAAKRANVVSGIPLPLSTLANPRRRDVLLQNSWDLLSQPARLDSPPTPLHAHQLDTAEKTPRAPASSPLFCPPLAAPAAHSPTFVPRPRRPARQSSPSEPCPSAR
jgi:hypothetical protein